MKAGKWNYKTQEYDTYELPNGCYLFTDDLNQKVACCQCGKQLMYGKMYTSKEIHNSLGLGYPVCESCYESELINEKQNNKN